MRATTLLTAVALLLANAWAEAGTAGWLGVELQTLTDELRLALDLPEEGGALINSVVDSSPADEAGLERRDFIVSFDGDEVDGPRHLGRLVRSRDPGENVVLEIIRDGETSHVEVRLGSRPEGQRSSRDWRRGGRGWWFPFLSGARARLGVRVVDLGEQMADFLEAPEAAGVLVLEVEEDSPAEAAGVTAGDIITAIDGDEVLDSSDLVDALQGAEGGEVIELTVLRRGETKQLEVELEASEGGPFFWDDFRDLWRRGSSHHRLQCSGGHCGHCIGSSTRLGRCPDSRS